MWRTARRSTLSVGRLNFAGVLGAVVIAPACDQSPVRPPSVPTPLAPVPEQPAPPAVNAEILAGAYVLTMEFPPDCGVVPEE